MLLRWRWWPWRAPAGLVGFDEPALGLFGGLVVDGGDAWGEEADDDTVDAAVVVPDGSISEYWLDFRRVRGKNPNANRGTRPISTGPGKLSICTHDSGFQTRSPSTSADGVSSETPCLLV